MSNVKLMELYADVRDKIFEFLPNDKELFVEVYKIFLEYDKLIVVTKKRD